MDIREWNLVASGDFSRRHPWETARLWSVFRLLRQNGFHAHTPFTILDFGAGDLFVAMGIKSAFPKAHIVSIDSAYDETLMKTLRQIGDFDNIHAYNSVEKWVPVGDKKADVVLLLDVLEHCPDDTSVLKMLNQSGKVRDDAVFLITVPAYQTLFTRYDKFLGHFRRYRFGQLSQAVMRAGLVVRQGGYFFCALVGPRAVGKVLEVLGLASGEPKGLAGFRPAAMVGKAIASVLYVDFLLLTLLNRFGIRLPGLSCYVVAAGRKTATPVPASA